MMHMLYVNMVVSSTKHYPEFIEKEVFIQRNNGTEQNFGVYLLSDSMKVRH